MPDISMCANATCPLRQSCYRHAESGAVPDSPHQRYAEFEPIFVENAQKREIGFMLGCDGYEPKRDHM